MSVPVAVAAFIAGLGLVVFFSERLVEATVKTSLTLGVSTFVVSVVFIGFDPENLAVGGAGSWEGATGIAMGSIVGSAMVAVALALGITALLAPMRFERAPGRVLVVPVAAVALFGGLALDGRLGRVDGAVLLVAFVVAVAYLVRAASQGLDIRPHGEVAEVLEGHVGEVGERNLEGEGGEEGSRGEARNEARKDGARRAWRPLGLLALSLVAIVAGSELVVWASATLVSWLGISETVFGMTALALLVSIEEVARELPAAWRGRPEITFGNVLGSVLAFFLFNAGVIALIRPLRVAPEVLRFYLPVCFATVVVISVFMLTRRIPRWAGALLLGLYVLFVAGGG